MSRLFRRLEISGLSRVSAGFRAAGALGSELLLGSSPQLFFNPGFCHTEMKITLLIMVAGAGLLAGCAHERQVTSAPAARTQNEAVSGIGYDDRQISKIQRGTTAEAQLLEWFGLPESREVKPDGRAHLSWSFSHRTDGDMGSGALSVNLASDGTVESYAARSGPAPDGNAARFAYDDRRLAQIRRGQTTGSQLVDWFGPPHSRQVGPDGRAQLAWSFARRSDGGPGQSDELQASLASDNTVDAYSAHRGR